MSQDTLDVLGWVPSILLLIWIVGMHVWAWRYRRSEAGRRAHMPKEDGDDGWRPAAWQDRRWAEVNLDLPTVQLDTLVMRGPDGAVRGRLAVNPARVRPYVLGTPRGRDGDDTAD